MANEDNQQPEQSGSLDSFEQAERLLALGKKADDNALELTKQSMANLSGAADELVLRLAGLRTLGSNADLLALAKADPT